MSDSRTDSLAARLKRAGLFDEYFCWVFSERPSFSDRLEWLEKHSCSTSAGAVHRLHRSPEAAVWRSAEAAKARRAMEANLPKDLEETFRKSLLNARFNEVMGELSHKEMMDHYQLELDSAHLKLKERQVALKEKVDPAKLAQADRRIALLEGAAQQAKAKLQGITSKGGLTPETLRQIEEAAGLL